MATSTGRLVRDPDDRLTSHVALRTNGCSGAPHCSAMEFGEQPQSTPPLPLTKSAYRALRQLVRHAASDTLGSEQTITPQQHLFGRPVA